MDWKRRYADKLVPVAEGARMVTSGQKLWVGMFTCTPESLCKELLGRARELEDVGIVPTFSRFSVGLRLIHS